MGLRFRKSLKLSKFLRINLSKSGISLSGGLPGARASINNKGVVRKSIGAVGSGIYYSEQHKINTAKSTNNKVPMKKIRLIPICVISLALCAFGFAPIGVIIFVGSLAWNHSLNKGRA